MTKCQTSVFLISFFIAFTFRKTCTCKFFLCSLEMQIFYKPEYLENCLSQGWEKVIIEGDVSLSSSHYRRVEPNSEKYKDLLVSTGDLITLTNHFPNIFQQFTINSPPPHFKILLPFNLAELHLISPFCCNSLDPCCKS